MSSSVSNSEIVADSPIEEVKYLRDQLQSLQAKIVQERNRHLEIVERVENSAEDCNRQLSEEKARVVDLELRLKEISRQNHELKDRLHRSELSYQECSVKLQSASANCTRLEKELEKSKETKKHALEWKQQYMAVSKQKERLISKTEEDSRRIHDIWKCTLRKHRDQSTFFDESLQTLQIEREALRAKVEELSSLLNDKSKYIEELHTERENLLERICNLDSTLTANEEEIEKGKVIISISKKNNAQCAATIERLKSEILVLQERQHRMTRENELLGSKLKACSEELQNGEEEIEYTKEEFGCVIEHLEQLIRQLQDENRRKIQKHQSVHNSLHRERSMIKNRLKSMQSQIGQYDNVLACLNTTLGSLTKSDKQPTRQRNNKYNTRGGNYHQALHSKRKGNETISIFDAC